MIDTGSQVTTISEHFVKSNLPNCPIKAVNSLLTLKGAGDNILPYCGYVEVEICFDSFTCPVLALVVCGDAYTHDVPVVIGTNVIVKFYEHCTKGRGVDTVISPWKMSFQSIKKLAPENGILGTVYTTRNETIQPKQKVLINGLTRACSGISTHKVLGVTESVQEHRLPGGLLITPSIVSVGNIASTYRISVEVNNTSLKPLTIPSKFPLCELHKVEQVTHDDVSPNADSVFLEHFKFPNNPEYECALKNLLLKWKHLFALSDIDCGHTSLTHHSINLTDDTPIRIKHRKIPPSMYDEVRQHIKDLLSAGHIRPSSSPWCFPVVLVRKKDKSLRVCVDYRELNKRTIRDAYSIPRIDDTLDALSGSKLFSCLDLKSGYYQVPMNEEHIERTAFSVSPLGFFEFVSMPFGLTNSPATFQRLMENCMGNLHLNQCLIYLDDIIVYSSTLEEHINRLEAVFDKLSSAGLKLKPSKCEFFKSEVKYLGHIVSSDGVKTDPDKIKVVVDWPVPNSVKDVQRFLGFSGFYRRFVPGYSKIAKPLHSLLQGHNSTSKSSKSKHGKFFWSDDSQKAFDTLKSKLTSTPVLAFADYTLPFELHTDASGTGLGAILYQTQNNQKRVIAYASRGLNPSEKNYPAHKLEFLALKWAITDKFHDYLYGQNLKYLLTIIH